MEHLTVEQWAPTADYEQLFADFARSFGERQAGFYYLTFIKFFRRYHYIDDGYEIDPGYNAKILEVWLDLDLVRPAGDGKFDWGGYGHKYIRLYVFA